VLRAGSVDVPTDSEAEHCRHGDASGDPSDHPVTEGANIGFCAKFFSFHDLDTWLVNELHGRDYQARGGYTSRDKPTDQLGP
jgi:hypothetical protein